MKSTARHLSVLYWGSPATLHKHCQSVSIGSAAPCFIVGLQLQHDSLKQCHLLISRFLFRWTRRTQFPWPKKTYGHLWAIGRPNSGDDPTFSLLQLVSWFTHEPIISQVAGTNISTTGMFQTSLHWRMLRMYCAKCPAKYPAKNSLSLKVGGNICK